MKKTSRIEIAREIISNLQKETERVVGPIAFATAERPIHARRQGIFPFGRLEREKQQQFFDSTAFAQEDSMWEIERDFIVRHQGPWLGLSSS